MTTIDCNKKDNQLAEKLCRTVNKFHAYQDENNIVWKLVDNLWVGKRSVWTHDFRAVWLEETTVDNVKSWWCGTCSDYKEVFYRN